MAKVEARLIRCLTKDAEGKFVNAETVEVPGIEVLRTSIYIDEAAVAETLANFEYTGLLYEQINIPNP